MTVLTQSHSAKAVENATFRETTSWNYKDEVNRAAMFFAQNVCTFKEILRK